MTRIATIIVTWNQTALTLECLTTLAAANVPLVDTWVVDNGSEPAAFPEIAAHFPAVQHVRLERNRGFAGGCNAGAQAAIAAGVEALFLLNNDALVEPDTLPVLEAALWADPRAAAVAPKVYYYNTAKTIQSVGLQVDPDSGQARMLGGNTTDQGQYDQPADRDALFGCALLVRAEAWQRVGGFWEPFFSYAEEIDWCLRARRLGWRLRYIPDAVVWHRTSSTLGWNSPLKAYLIARNQLYLRQRHRRSGWRSYWGLAYALYIFGRTIAHYLRTGQRAQAQAVTIAVWDYLHRRTGNTRTPDLMLRTAANEYA
jgi:GT2 family glycosyltransferase